MPNASTQTIAETQTGAGLGPTRKPISDSTKTKYDQAIKRIKDAGLNLETQVKEVIAWVKSKGGDSAQKTYYSAIKYELGKLDKPFYLPQPYQDEIDRLYGLQNKKDNAQELTEKQVSNFVPYTQLLAIQERLGAKEDKSDKDWKDYLIASLYTLQPPVRADYGAVQVVGKRGNRPGNQLVWGQKQGAYFIWKEYKTSKIYGTREVRVSDALHAVIRQWFEHLGKTPKYLLGRSIDSNDLLGEIQHAFRQTGKTIGVNLLRHAYIKHHFPALTTINQKETLAYAMLHSKEKQEQYNSQNV